MAIADELNELKQTKASIKEKLINKDLEICLNQTIRNRLDNLVRTNFLII